MGRSLLLEQRHTFVREFDGLAHAVANDSISFQPSMEIGNG
jgi:hypothetical protein